MNCARYVNSCWLMLVELSMHWLIDFNRKSNNRHVPATNHGELAKSWERRSREQMKWKNFHRPSVASDMPREYQTRSPFPSMTT